MHVHTAQRCTAHATVNTTARPSLPPAARPTALAWQARQAAKTSQSSKHTAKSEAALACSEACSACSACFTRSSRLAHNTCAFKKPCFVSYSHLQRGLQRVQRVLYQVVQRGAAKRLELALQVRLGRLQAKQAKPTVVNSCIKPLAVVWCQTTRNLAAGHQRNS